MSKILIVDDRVLNRQFLFTLLGYSGHVLIEATNGAEALEKVRAERPDLVITDLLMPTMDGFEFTQKLRAEPDIAHTQVIFYTATYRVTEAKSLADACGVSVVIPKPSEPSLILDTVSAILQKTTPPRAGVAAIIPVETVATEGQLRGKLTEYVLDLQLLNAQMTELVHHGTDMAARESALLDVSGKLRRSMTDLQAVSLKLAALLELGLELTAHRDPDRLFELFCRAATDVLDAKYGALAVLRDDGESFAYLKCHAASKEELADKMTPPSPRAGVLGSLLDEPRTRRLRNLGGDPESLGLSPSHPSIHSFIGVPILSSQQVYGWFYVVDKLNDDGFSEGDEQLAETLAAQLAVVYQAVQRYDDIQRHAARLELEADRRKKAEARFYSAIQAAPNGMLMVDGAGKIVLVNSKIVEMFQYQSDELIGQSVEMLLPERARDAHVQHRSGFMQNPQTRNMGVGRDLYGRRKDGTEFPVEIGLNPLATGDGVNVLASVIDITERKKVETALRVRSAALTSAANTIVITDRNGFITWVNPSFCTLTGYSSQEAIGSNPRLLKSGMHDERFYRDLWETILSGEVWSGEIVNRRKDGTFYTEDQSITPVCDDRGEITHFIAIKQDITERKKAEAMQRERMRLAEFTADVSGALATETDLRGMLQKCAEAVVQHLEAAFARVWTLNTNENVLELQASAGMYTHIDGGHSRVPVGQFKIGLIAHERRPYLTNSVVGDPRVNDQEWAKREGMVGFAGYPLLVDGRVVGVIAMFYRRPIPAAIFEALASGANGIAVGIERKVAEGRARQHFNRIRTLHEIDRAITSTLDLQSVFAVILDSVAQYFPRAAAVGIALCNPDTGLPEPVACRGMVLEEWGRAFFTGDSSINAGALHGPFVIADLCADPHIRPLEREFVEKSGHKSLLFVPIQIDERILGLIGFATIIKHSFSSNEIEFLSTLAGQVAVAIQNAELYQETKKQHLALIEQERIQRVLKELSQDIARMDVDTLIEKLTGTIREVFKVDIADVRFLGAQKWEKVLITGDQFVKWLPEGGPFGRGANIWVVNNRRSLAIRDHMEQTEFPPGRVAQMFGIRGFLAAPMIGRSGAVLGVIRALSKQPRTFTAQEINLFEQLANGAAIAIENETLYQNLEKSDQIKSEFLGMMSHELRTPLNVIMGYAALVKDDLVRATDEPQRQSMLKIESQARDMLAMVNRIMEASHIKSGVLDVTQRRVDVGRLLDQLKSEYPGKENPTLIWQAPDPAVALTTDYEKLKHILQNLIDNAIKFTESGTITISAYLVSREASPIADFGLRISDSSPELGTAHSQFRDPHSAIRNQRFVEFSVADTGIGIAPDRVPVIFDLFQQADSSTTREHEGVGLGLYLVKKYCELLGGQVQLESEPGKGSTFRFVLPANQRY